MPFEKRKRGKKVVKIKLNTGNILNRNKKRKIKIENFHEGISQENFRLNIQRNRWVDRKFASFKYIVFIIMGQLMPLITLFHSSVNHSLLLAFILFSRQNSLSKITADLSSSKDQSLLLLPILTHQLKNGKRLFQAIMVSQMPLKGKQK